jgi:signal transduction histidine kinase
MGNFLIEKLKANRSMKPVLIAAAGIVITIVLWVALAHNERQGIRQHVVLETDAVRNELLARMEARLRALDRLSYRTHREVQRGPDEWKEDVRAIYAHFGGYQAIEWADAQGVIRLAVPEKGNEEAIGFDMNSREERREAMTEARQSRKMAVTDPTQLAQGGRGFLAIWPLYGEDGAVGGYLVGAFRTAELLDSILKNINLAGYNVSVWHEGQEIYRSAPADPSIESRWAQQQNINAYDLDWNIRVWPGRELLKNEHSFLPEVVLACGVGMSILLALIVHLAQTARRQTLHTQQTNLALEDEILRRQMVETKLQEAAIQLEQSNRELQDFASVASHDLQEPLRKILAFGDRLRTRSAGDLGPESCDYLDRMQNAAGRMQNLITDLLAFSRITTRAQPFVPTDLSVVAHEVVDDLEARIEQSHGTVNIEPLPTIDADPMQIRQLLQNLISNALKFHKPDEPARVRVFARHAVNGQTQCELSVEDNGIGFDEKYLDRIFTVFQRLHGRGEYEGTGIGLAVCRKIVERHGGTITAHSRVGAGSTFVILLPFHHAKEQLNHDSQADHDIAGG